MGIYKKDIQTTVNTGGGGGFNAMLTFNPTSVNFDSITFVDLAGVTNQSISFPETGNYIFQLIISGPYTAGADNGMVWGLVVDDGTPVAYPQIPMAFFASAPRYMGVASAISTSITAGTRDIRLQLKLDSNGLGKGIIFTTGIGSLILIVQKVS